MSWIRFDDQYPIHRKVAPLSDAAFRLNMEAMGWCSRNGTDGVIRKTDLAHVSAKRGKPAKAAELVNHELWHPAGQLCGRCAVALIDADRQAPPDGWVIHGYLEYQPSAAKVATEREAKAKRQARWLANRRGSDASVDGSEDASHEPVDNSGSDELRASSKSITTRNNAGNLANSKPVNNASPQPNTPGQPPRDASEDDAPSRPVPSPTTNGDLGGQLTDRKRPPFPRCERHKDRPAAGPCGPCADARRAREAWDQADADRRRTQAQCRKHPSHRGQPADRCALCRSEALEAK